MRGAGTSVVGLIQMIRVAERSIDLRLGEIVQIRDRSRLAPARAIDQPAGDWLHL